MKTKRSDVICVTKQKRKFCRVRELLLLVVIFLVGYAEVSANNIRINGKPKVTGFIGSDTAVVELNLSWDNSWRDDLNWDAVWIFLKYKKRGAASEWHHGYLLREGHEAVALGGNEGGGYTFMFGEVGSGANAKVTGVYLMRDLISEGKVNVRLRLKWIINANTKNPLKISDFGNHLNNIYVAVHAIEMVYVPYGAYYLGDLYSHGSLQNRVIGSPLSALYDIIDNNSGFEYSIKNPIANGSVANIADRNPAAAYPNSTLYFNAVGGGWVQIDFKTPKTIRYFGVSAASNYCSGSQDCRPKGNWYLTGSNDSLTWTRLYTGINTDWKGTSVAYPVQNTLKVTYPGSYRYYRIEMSGAVRTDDGIVIQSIAMTEKDLESCMIDREDALSLATIGTAWTGSVGANYPKGYAGFYVMKYETSQEEYVEFLNSLTLVQQKAHVANNNFEQMKRGDYVFGDLKIPNCRNGIVFIEQKGKGGPAVFGNNLNQGNEFFSVDDGQTLACNYMSPYDMLAYCDWSGLRPMSELEYEKACRRPYPQLPDKGEYAWNAGNGVNSLLSENDLIYRGSETEQASRKHTNVNSGGYLNGPVRCGMFGTAQTNQSQSGATYWGVMDMSGNLWEMCYNVTANGAKFISNNFDYSHGNGELNAAGATDIAAAYWPSVIGAIGVRGGSFSSADSLLRTSDRTFAAGDYFMAMTQRDSTVGFRGVRGVLNTTGFDGGGIILPNGTNTDTTCVGSEVELTGVLPNNSIGKLSYVWYVSEDNGTSWKLIEGASSASLKYSDFVNTNTTATYRLYKFRRKVTCAVGEAETQASVYVAPLPWTVNLDIYTNVYPSFTVTSTWANMPQAHWKLDHAPAGISITSDKGVVSGLEENSIFRADVTVSSDKCPGQAWEKTLEVIRQFDYTGAEQSITLKPGNYKMECWGARGGGGYNTGGNGGYSCGKLLINVGVTFYIHVGQLGGISTATTYGGGGGGGRSHRNWGHGGQGGGATDIRVLSSAWNNVTGLCSRIMVAGGGGGGQHFAGNGYYSAGQYGGTGGGISGGNGRRASGAAVAAGTQTSGYSFGVGRLGRTSKGSGSASYEGGGGGGGGYYGGQAYTGTEQNSDASGGGGSGFISGMVGCNAVSASGSHTGSPNHYSGYVFTDCVMTNGVRNGAGLVRISPVVP